MGFEKEDNKSKVPFSTQPIEGTYDQRDLSLLVLTLITWRGNVSKISPL